MGGERLPEAPEAVSRVFTGRAGAAPLPDAGATAAAADSRALSIAAAS
ncbi:hypothetical protein [Streptomyces sp. NPDC094049]